MLDPDSISSLTQFGVAGMIGGMWLWERRAAGERERQLTETHERLSADRLQLNILVEVLRDNTRALAALESGQRELTALLARARGPFPHDPARRPGQRVEAT